MTNANLFPSMVLQMCAIGEESGSIDHMLGKAADFYEAEVDDMVAGISSLMEPIIIVVLGTVIGGIVVAKTRLFSSWGRWFNGRCFVRPQQQSGAVGFAHWQLLNVVIHRLPQMLERHGRRMRGTLRSARSQRCTTEFVVPRSGARIADTVFAGPKTYPYSVISFLRGRCSKCHASISLRYPFVELLTASLFAFCAWRWGISWPTLAWSIFCACLVALTFIDWDTTLLPDDLTLPLCMARIDRCRASVGPTPWMRRCGSRGRISLLWTVYWAFVSNRQGRHGIWRLQAVCCLGRLVRLAGIDSHDSDCLRHWRHRRHRDEVQ